MSSHTSVQQPNQPSDLTTGVSKRLLQLILITLFQAAVLFIAAGRLDWAMAWVYLAAYIANIAINAVFLLPRHRDLVAARSELKADTKRWDKILLVFYSTAAISILLVAGLDVRFGWTPPYNLAVHIVGLIFYELSFALVAWAMAANRFFASTVRIQTERGHTVVTGGPYHYVRHPGYVGMIVSALAMPFLLGTLSAFIPVVVLIGLTILRTALENRTLQAELPGYKEYAQRVRYRLLPGVW
jgi:protein-S-isoprenylcysteine O-methyltransferase Ste14